MSAALFRFALVCLVTYTVGAFLSKEGTRLESRRSQTYDPLVVALASIDSVVNKEATIPPQCYTKTTGDEGLSNPCWTCHTQPRGDNHRTDWPLQESYDVSDFARTNQWQNLFVDRRAAVEKISDAEALAHIREDNYTPLRLALANQPDYPGFIPDLDFRQGFDAEGFARDGSEWRALRYKPFPGTFWPTNGSTDDVMIRLPHAFRVDEQDRPSRAVYKLNLAILEAAITVAPGAPELARRVEPIDEHLAGGDLDKNGDIQSNVTLIRALPTHYAGGAQAVAVHRYLYPRGTEFLHTVRYIDPDRPELLSTRMKEVRYARKVAWLNTWARLRAYAHELEEKASGLLPVFPGSPMVGLQNAFGWQLQGFIEDVHGRLRVQTQEEHLFCMGCHSSLGVSVDQTFAFARKIPGREGWRHQSLVGISDVPQVGHTEPEILTYFRRVQGGDEFRANPEILERFFSHGTLDESQIRRAAPGGDQDITFVTVPSPKRALLLNKIGMVLAQTQLYTLGRDALLMPAENVHRSISGISTGLSEASRVYRDGSLWLDWEWRP